MDEFIQLFGEDFALTSYEIKPKLENFEKALSVYEKHVSELKRLGSSSQIEVAKSYLEWVYSIRLVFNLQYKMATSVENRVAELLLNQDENEEFIEFIDNALDTEIERLVRSENTLYYSEGRYKRTVIVKFEQYLNYQFRLDLGLEATLDMKESIESLPKAIEQVNYVFKEKKLPFAFASGRQMFADTLTLSEAGNLVGQKDQRLRPIVKMKFISAFIENNKILRKELDSKASKD